MIADLYRAYADHIRNERYRAADRAADFRDVFGDERGQRVLLELMRMVGFWRVNSVAGDTIALHMAEAQRALVMDIVREMTAVSNEDGSVEYLLTE